MNPEHGIWFQEAGDHQATRVDGLEADVRGQLEHGRLVRFIVTTDEHDGAPAVEGRIAHDVEADLVEGLVDLGALGPLGHLLSPGGGVAESQAREILRQGVGAVHDHLAREVAGGLEGVPGGQPRCRQH